MSLKKLLPVLGLLLIQQIAQAQGSEAYGSGLKLNINPEGSKYIRFIVWNQIWARSTQNNPGTLVNGEARKNTWDVGARRLRILTYAQITPRYLVLAHIGINNQTFATGGAARFTIDNGAHGLMNLLQAAGGILGVRTSGAGAGGTVANSIGNVAFAGGAGAAGACQHPCDRGRRRQGATAGRS
jgi:hypothetical protein